MSLVALDGGFIVPIGPSMFGVGLATPGTTAVTLDAAEEANISIGQVIWRDGGSHTIDTTGSSSIGWRTGAVTFANAGTTVKIGIGAVDAANGPPGRAANAANVITFDVNAAPVGGGGGITANAWITSVPTAGTKAIANGDLVAVSQQMTARGGTDSIVVNNASLSGVNHRLFVTSYTGATYANVTAAPNVILTASDGTLGWIYGSVPFSALGTRTWNSGSATKEYGQLYNLPFPCKIYGLYGNVNPTGDLDFVLYSDPLGTPVAEKTVSMDLNVVYSASSRITSVMFASPYTYTAERLVVAAFKPTTVTSAAAVYRTLASATHRIVDVGGVDSYGVNRDAAAFADDNSGLNQYPIGLLVGALSPSAVVAGLHPIDRGIA